MYSLPWYVILFESLPEAFLMLLLGFKLFNLNVEFKKILIISIIYCISVYFIRQLPITFGVHTLVMVIILMLLCRLIAKQRLLYCLMCVMTGVIIMGVLQSSILPILLSLLNVGMNELSLHPKLNILMFIPLAMIMLMIYYLINRYDFIIYDLSIHEE